MKTLFIGLCALSVWLVVTAKMCPGGGQACQSYMTCCELPSGRQGCCPYANATCCADKVHCCPQGYNCQTDHCQKQGEDEIAIKRELMIDYDESENEVVPLYHFTNLTIPEHKCPDGSTCRFHETCCFTGGQTYGCCPHAYGVCCPDLFTCCPEGFRCTHTDCVQDAGPNQVKVAAKSKINTISTGNAQNISTDISEQKCPDHGRCENNETCCPSGGGHYGCCPYKNATCCEDMESCCPEGSFCTPSFSLCLLPGTNQVEVAVKLKINTISTGNAQNISTAIPEHKCPDGSTCRFHETCCFTGGQTYGCCPQAYGVCCRDQTTCCPQGYICTATDCLLVGTNEVKVAVKTKIDTISTGNAQNISTGVSKTFCPDGGACEDHNTCCLISDTEYGCCPLERAVCCADRQTCCPHGTECAGGGMCTPGHNEVEVKLTKGSPINTICPGGIYTCPGTDTCCPVGGGQYGCCPLLAATCCSDQMHCCPHGYRCDGKGSCVRS